MIFQKGRCVNKKFLEDFDFLIVRRNLHIQFVKKHLIKMFGFTFMSKVFLIFNIFIIKRIELLN
jgi:hypothetical protein